MLDSRSGALGRGCCGRHGAWEEGRPLFTAIVVLLGALAAIRGASAQQPLLILLDDRGKAVDAPVEICFDLAGRSDCRRATAGEAVRAPAAFASVRIDGDGHGPISVGRDALRQRPDGSLSVTVARKAWLAIDAPGRRDPLTVSLYPPHDPTLREPFFRTTLRAGETQLRVPSGLFIASLALARNAPDLHRLEAASGSKVRLAYTARGGWSLVARFRAAGTDRTVGGVRVSLASALGFGAPAQSLGEGVSAGDGVALCSGIGAALASLTARRSGFVDSLVPAVVAGEGSFALRDVELFAGGRLHAVVTVNGHAPAGASCGLAAFSSSEPGKPYREVWQGITDAVGACVSKPLPAGGYKLTVQLPDSAAQEVRWVGISEAQVTTENVALHPTRVSGKVKRGEEGQPGYTVSSRRVEIDWPLDAQADPGSEAETDEDGHYELMVLAPGRYIFSLRSPSGSPAGGHRDLSTWGDEDKELDFDLRPGSLQGRVVDEGQAPVPQASVILSSHQGALIAKTDDSGNFNIDIQEDGPARLFARKEGYQSSDALSLDLSVPVPPLSFVLKKGDTLRGTVVSSAGAPVPGAVISSLVTTGSAVQVFDSSRSRPDGSFELAVPPGTPLLFVSGPGCPLFAVRPAQDLPANDAGAAGSGAAVVCPASPAAIEMALVDDAGAPISAAGVILRTDGLVVPRTVLLAHLAMLGLTNDTDGSGHLVVPWLAPGEYDLFLDTRSSEATIAAGYRSGFLTTVALSPLGTAELQLTFSSTPAP